MTFPIRDDFLGLNENSLGRWHRRSIRLPSRSCWQEKNNRENEQGQSGHYRFAPIEYREAGIGGLVAVLT
jgi:hypothetical protein